MCDIPQDLEPDELLVQAVRSGSRERMEAALSVGANVHFHLPSTAHDLPNGSLLALAAGLGHTHLVPVLLSAGIHVDDGGGFGYTPLQVAVHQGKDSMVETLLKVQPEGPDVNAVAKGGVTSLHLAARKGRMYSAKALIDAGADLNARDNSMRTPLHVSVLGKSTNIMKLLLDAGCNVQAVNDKGFSVLHIAALSGNEKAVQELRMAGVETDRKDSMGLMPEDVADVWGSHGTAWLLRKMPKATRTTTRITTANPSSNIMMDGRSPIELYWKLLITISVSDDIGEARKLLSSGAPLQATKDLRTDAMVLAITCNRPRIVTLLAAAGAPLTTISGGLSLLQVAWLTPDVTTRVRVLITRIFLNVLKVEQDRVRPQDSLLRSGIDYLLDGLRSDAPVKTAWPFRNKAYSNLTNLLVAAARNNCPLTATFLKLCGGMAFKQNDQGTTPLHVALEANQLGMARGMVRDLGACPYVTDSQGNLPLDLLQPEMKKQVEEEIYEQERHKIENYQEKEKDQEDKNTYQDVLEVLETLFAKHVGLSEDTPPEPLLTQTLLVASHRGMHLLTYLVIKVGGLSINTVVDPMQDSTALHQAASHGHTVCVALLLSLGACVLQQDRYGHTAAHLAAMFCHKLTYRLLIKEMDQQYLLSRAGKAHRQVAQDFKAYLKLYNKVKVVDPQKSLRFNDTNVAIRELLTEDNFRNKLKKLKKYIVDFSQGEAKEVKEAVVKEVGALVSHVADQNSLYDGRLVLVGSSADNSRLYAPDEFDMNLVVSGVEGVEVRMEELASHEALLQGHPLRARVRADHSDLQGIAFKNNFLPPDE
ncbi:hypothetical protein O3P69_007122 [Scylla paramamosain]|uniref:Uncharacterized protein n=2 Tax=Scylla paramamosain TaxID=85552 RepID=A0AAW0V2J6_SCYPA